MLFLTRLLQIKEGEGKKVLTFFLGFFFVIGSFMFGRTARDTFFLSRFPTKYLPHMFILIAIVIGITIAIYTRISKRYSLFPLTMMTFAVGAGSFLVIQIFLAEWIYPVLYVWFEVIGTIMMIQFWMLANSAFTSREAKRLFSVVASGAAIANTALGFSMGTLVNLMGTDFLLPATSLFIGLGLITVFFMKQHLTPITPAPARGPSSSSKKKKGGMLGSSYLKVMTITIVAASIVGALVDYQMKMIVSELPEDQMADLFGKLYGTIGFISIFMQFFVTGRFLSTFGVLWALMFLPGALLLGSVMIIVSPILLSGVLAKAGDQIFRFTLHDTSSQLLWLPVSPQEKGRAKPFIDGTIKNGAGGLSGLLIMALMYLFNDIRMLSVPSVAFLVIWILSNFKLKQGYVAELRKAIEKRRIDFESLEVDITDPLIVETLRKTLVEGDDHQKLFALDTMKDMTLTPWADDLRNLFREGSPVVQKKVLQLARDEEGIVSDEDIVTMMKSEDDSLAAEGMIISGERKLELGYQLLKSTLSSSNSRRRSAAAAGILIMSGDDTTEARATLDSMLFDPDNRTQVAALKSVGQFPEIVTDDGLVTLLRDDAAEVRGLASELSIERTNPALIPPLADNLGTSATAPSARRALKSYDSSLVTRTLLEKLDDTDASADLKTGIIRSLSEYAKEEETDVLISTLEDAEQAVAREIVDALVKISRRKHLTEEQLDRTDEILRSVINNSYRHLELLRQFQDDDASFLVQDQLRTSIEKLRTQVIKLSLLPFPESPVETFLMTLSGGDPSTKANVLEILDNLLARETREKIVPLFDDSSLEEKTDIGTRVASFDKVQKTDVLVEWAESSDVWTSAVAIDYITIHNLADLVANGNIAWGQVPNSKLIREVCSIDWYGDESILGEVSQFDKSKFILEEKPMYSTLEKTIFMKGVDLFHDISGEEVSHAAQIAEEVQLEASETIFKEGDIGDSMFIIVDGAVRIHKGEKEIAVLSKGKFIGEMALLDQEPRSASVTTTEETVLLKINGEDFYDLMASRMEIMQGIVKVLTHRLREAIA